MVLGVLIPNESQVNNAAYQMMQRDLTDFHANRHKNFNTNIHPYFYLSKCFFRT